MSEPKQWLIYGANGYTGTLVAELAKSRGHNQSWPGAPLDNNIAERALKMAILHRKNSLSFKTLHGARIGDVHMSLIHTCELNRVNLFDFLMALQQHAAAVPKAPESWLPWNYPQLDEALGLTAMACKPVRWEDNRKNDQQTQFDTMNIKSSGAYRIESA